jgi:YD repeat-containing protein
VTSSTDPVGNQSIIVYADPNYPYLPTLVEQFSSNGTAISTNQFVYTCTSNIVIDGYVTNTNQAFGLLARSIRATNSVDAATNDFFYDARGYLTNSIKYTGTGDPNITNFYFFNNAGELVQQTDAAGRMTTFEYDAMNRLISKEVFNSNSATPMYWENDYYDDNGEILWQDNARYNPEDYVWFDYDGAGRKTEEIHWRSEAKADGSGVEAANGDNLYATTFYQYDGFGNLVKQSDQMGNYTRMAYDALGQLLDRRAYQPNSPAPLTVEDYAYEPGGQVSIYTNALGGATYKYYTTAGKLKQQINPDGSTNQWTYYLDGRPHREYLANGNYYETIYDDANRLVERTFSGDPSYLETKAYDRRGNPSSRPMSSAQFSQPLMTVWIALNRASVRQPLGEPASK